MLGLADDVQRTKPDEVAQERALIGVSARGPRPTLFLLLQMFTHPQFLQLHEHIVILNAIRLRQQVPSTVFQAKLNSEVRMGAGISRVQMAQDTVAESDRKHHWPFRRAAR